MAFNIGVAQAAATHAGQNLYVKVSALSGVRPRNIQLTIQRTVELRSGVTGVVLQKSTNAVQRYRGERPFEVAFEGTFFVLVPRRCVLSTPACTEGRAYTRADRRLPPGQGSTVPTEAFSRR